MTFRLACFYPTEDGGFFFAIEIEGDAFVYQLIKPVCQEIEFSRREKLNVDTTRVFKTDISLRPPESQNKRVLQWLHGQQQNSPLHSSTRIADIFPTGQGLTTNLDIVVVVDGTFELADVVDDPDGHYNRKVKKAFSIALEELATLPSPSSVIKSAGTIKQIFGVYKIHLNQVPPAIFSPPLANLQRQLEHLDDIPITSYDISRSSFYHPRAIEHYSNKEERQAAVKGIVEEVFGGGAEWMTLIAEPKITPDVAWWSHGFITCLMELKNNPGLYGDALLQAVIDYAKIVSQTRYKKYRPYCSFPAVLIALTGPRIQVAIVVGPGPVYASELISVDLASGFHASEAIIKLARIFKAISNSCSELEKYYQGVDTASSNSRTLIMYPSPTCVSGTSLPLLTYRHVISRAGRPTSELVDLGDVTSAIYGATLTEVTGDVGAGGRQVKCVVKFTAQYSEDAHRCLANQGLAPPLYFCERVVGGLYMVVMEHVEAESLWRLRLQHKLIPPIVLTKVEEALNILHNAGIVFGDLRDPNILFAASDDAASEGRVFLVDFDWPGMDGEHRYPATLNRENGYHSEVLPFGVMRKVHDLFMLEKLKRFDTAV